MDLTGFGQHHMESLVFGNDESSESATGECEIGSDSWLPAVVVIFDLWLW